MRFVALMCVLVSCAWCQPCSAQRDNTTTKRVVVVQASHFFIPASMLAAEAMREALVAGANDTVVLDSEALDGIERMGIAPEQEMRELQRLRQKYANTRVHLVMPVGSIALEFVERNRASIWPGARVVYYGVSDRRIEGETFAADVQGLTIHFDVAGTLALAMRMQPDSRNVVYVSGSAPYDKVFEPMFAEAMRPHGSQFTVKRLVGLPLSALRRELAQVPGDSIVLYASMFLDDNGAAYVPADVARSLSEISAAPVYGFFSSHLGRGIVGGSIVDFEEHGRRAGLLAASILNGDGAVSSTPLVFPSTCALDTERMKHWQVPARLAPAHCRLMFRKPPFWEAHRQTLLLAAGALVLLSGMGVALRSQARRRDAAEREATQRRQEATHAARLALVGEISASIVHEVTQPLSAILSNADTAQMLLDRSNPSLSQIREIIADIRRDDVRAHQIVSRLRSLLKKGELQMDHVDVNELTVGAVALIQAEARHRSVVIDNTPDPSLPLVRGDPIHLQQVLLNLLVNALDSMDSVPASDRRVEVRTCAEANTVSISIRDSGTGIPADSLATLFDSFFTTKRNGIGLGLSIAKTIVDAHGGTLSASTRASGGAEFRLTLPALGAQVHSAG